MSQSEITDRELNERLAVEVMGHELPEAWSDPSVGPSHGDPGGYRVGVRPYSTDISAAMEAENRIAELDLGAEYADALKTVVAASWKERDISPGLFGLIHATPRERCLAALKTIEANSYRYETVTSEAKGK